MDSFAITSSRPAWLTTGNFGLKSSPNGFAIFVARWIHRPINARSAPFSKRNKANEEREHVAPRFPIVQRHLQGPGTGMTNLPSFSATKFSELLDELPLPSFFSTLMTSFFVGLRFRQTLPVGPSIGVVAFLTSSGVRLTRSMVEIFSPAPPDCIILKNSSASGSEPCV